MSCAKDGFCELTGRREALLDKAVDFGKDKVIDYAEDKALERIVGEGKQELVQEGIIRALESFGSSRAGILATMAGRLATSAVAGVILGLFDSRPFSLNQDGYRNTTQAMTGKFDQLKMLAAELKSYRAGGPSRTPQMIFADIQNVRVQLSSDVQMLTLYLDGINRERELGRHACYQVMNVQHQQLMNAYGRVVALTAMGAAEIDPNRVH
jgi:hypothetical protein